MSISGVSGLCKTIKLTNSSIIQLVGASAAKTLTTIQSLIFFVENSASSDASVAVYVTNNGATTNTMNITVPVGTTKIVTVKQQLPTGYGLSVALSSGSKATVTANGVVTSLD